MRYPNPPPPRLTFEQLRLTPRDAPALRQVLTAFIAWKLDPRNSVLAVLARERVHAGVNFFHALNLECGNSLQNDPYVKVPF